MRKLLFYWVVYPCSIALNTGALYGLLTLCQTRYPGAVLPATMAAVLWLAGVLCACAGVEALAKHWRV